MAMGTGAAMGISAGASLLGSFAEADSTRRAQKFENMTVEQNIRFNQLKEVDVLYRGKVKGNEVRRNAKQVIADQELAAASQGLDISSGNIASLVNETNYLSELDVNVIKNDATREAFGIQMDSMNMKYQNKFNQIQSKAKANMTLATGGLKAVQGYATSTGYGAAKK